MSDNYYINITEEYNRLLKQYKTGQITEEQWRRCVDYIFDNIKIVPKEGITNDD